MEEWKGFVGKASGYAGSSTPDEDFEEEDVWSSIKEREDYTSTARFPKEYSSVSSSAWRLPSTPRRIRKVNTQTTHEAEVVQPSSAPVDIPDWSKIYGKSAKMDSRAGPFEDHGFGAGNGVASHIEDYRGVGDYEDDDGDDDVMVPPHEWLARKLARNQISSFSVCEGIGRTLKGRDLSKMRNAILTKTGFLE